MPAEVSLWQEFASYFPIGTAVNPAVLHSHDKLLELHFNSITAENEMKPCHLQPEEGHFEYNAADGLVAFARDKGMRVRGHTLVWHNQTPQWFFLENVGVASQATVLQRMREHIRNVADHFRGSVYCWDVVNEAIDDIAEGYLRRSPWLDILGEGYIAEAFRSAHEADPSALLFYNDYDECNPDKCTKICRLLRGLQEQGVPLHGMGLQAHWNIYGPTLEQIREAMDRYASLGLQLQITELDISLYAFEDRRPEALIYDERLLELQALYYEKIFKLFREYSHSITGITFWGVADSVSWLNNFPVRNRANAPLLFDRNQLPKSAFQRILSPIT